MGYKRQLESSEQIDSKKIRSSELKKSERSQQAQQPQKTLTWAFNPLALTKVSATRNNTKLQEGIFYFNFNSAYKIYS